MRGGTEVGLVLLLAGSLAGGCFRSESPPVPPSRLLDAGARAVVAWPSPAPRVPAQVAGAEIGSIPTPGRVGRVIMHQGELGRDSRAALLAPTPSRYRFPVAIPEGDPVLQVALGYLTEPAQRETTLRFRIGVTPSGGEAEDVLDESVRVAPDGEWLDRQVSLARWAGRTVRIELETEAATPGPPVWAAWAAPEGLDRGRVQDGWNVVLISLDTLRPDHLGCYGYDRPTSPSLDALARRSIRFAVTVSQSSWTRPAHHALFTGLYPLSRGGLSSAPLAEMLWRAGYRTAAITGGAQLAYRFGFSRGFEMHRIARWPRSIDMVVRELRRDRSRKHFLFLHTYEIHDPYEHSDLAGGLDPGRVGPVFSRAVLRKLGGDLTDGEKEYVRALYDSGIHYTDHQVGLLVSRLREEGLLARTLLIVMSDHGEDLWERSGWGHGHAMFDRQTRVPLIVHVPEAMRKALGLELGPGAVVRQQVRLFDLYPTILDLLGVKLDHPIQARSLRPLLAGGRLPPAPAFSEDVYWGPIEVKGLRTDRFKYLVATPRRPDHDDAPGWEALYDLRQDPDEEVDVQQRHPDVLQRMRSIVARIVEDAQGPEAPRVPEDLDPELEKQLRALGYIGG